ncbi:MAG TPA: HD domain-containing protein [Solirubrobacteraceae bacterium]|nr:HD domain-containing protein [Solirubrobacteraceae bacterium]
MSTKALEIVRSALAGRRAWLVGGAVRDRLLGRAVADLDVVFDGDPGQAARAIAALAKRTGTPAACFALSEEFGAWRVVARGGTWQVDVEALRGDSLQADLRMRDFTVNAIAEPLVGGETLDPLGGLLDLRAGRLRMASPTALEDDPLRVLRLVRVAVELGLQPVPEAIVAARAQASRLEQVSPERVFVELQRIVASAQALRGLELMSELGATRVVLPELEAMRGVEQSRFHHRDVYGHTLEVLERTVELTADASVSGSISDAGVSGSIGDVGVPGSVGDVSVSGPIGDAGVSGPIGDVSVSEPISDVSVPGSISDASVSEMVGDVSVSGPIGALGVQQRAPVLQLLAEPLADGMTRGQALRWAALLHDAAKPTTRSVRVLDRRVTFIGHDVQGAELAREVLGRLRASVRLREHVAALVRHHLRLGFLVHEEQPLARDTVYRYLRACDPVEVDVTLLSVCDRLATRGAKADYAIAAHVALARRMLDDALRWRQDGPPKPLLRGDELARELGIALGPRVGQLLGELAEAQYTGRVSTREQALALMRTRY